MSSRALAWALSCVELDAPIRLTLIYLADYANEYGEDAMPSKARMQRVSGVSESTLKRHYRELQRLGYIELGTQESALRYPPNRRPTVWRLRLFDPVDNSLNRGVMGDPPLRQTEVSRGVKNGGSGGSLVAPNTKTDPKTITNSSFATNSRSQESSEPVDNSEPVLGPCPHEEPRGRRYCALCRAGTSRAVAHYTRPAGRNYFPRDAREAATRGHALALAELSKTKAKDAPTTKGQTE